MLTAVPWGSHHIENETSNSVNYSYLMENISMRRFFFLICESQITQCDGILTFLTMCEMIFMGEFCSFLIKIETFCGNFIQLIRKVVIIDYATIIMACQTTN